MSIEIVPIAVEHIEGFHAALDVVSRERHYLAFLQAPPIEMTRKFVENSLAERLPQYVALDGARVVGWCDVTGSERPTMRHSGTLGMGLLPEWRGRGVGARLMGAVLDASRRRGFSRIALTVRADNERAIRLYRRMGFEIEGRLRRGMRIDDQFHDLLAMALLFDVKTDAGGCGTA